jgi:hypothetical protein
LQLRTGQHFSDIFANESTGRQLLHGDDADSSALAVNDRDRHGRAALKALVLASVAAGTVSSNTLIAGLERTM